MKVQRIGFMLLSAVLLICLIRPETDMAAVASAEITTQEPKYVALTFDDGPRADTTGRLLDGLKARDAKATFFLIGRQIAGNEDLVCRMKAEGHQVGNHTWNHVRIESASYATVEEEVGRTEQTLCNLLGNDTYWLRPPYGQLGEQQRSWFCVPLIKWSVDPQDWKVKNAEKVRKAVEKVVQPGDIILLHDFYSTSVDAALEIVDDLQAKGYQFVTLEKLFSIYGVCPECGVIYRTPRQ